MDGWGLNHGNAYYVLEKSENLNCPVTASKASIFRDEVAIAVELLNPVILFINYIEAVVSKIDCQV